jgi:hypothetical protein
MLPLVNPELFLVNLVCDPAVPMMVAIRFRAISGGFALSGEVFAHFLSLHQSSSHALLDA